jgi:ABC-type uncharacterized transport system permease subunit
VNRGAGRVFFSVLAALAGLLAAGVVALVAGESPIRVIAILAHSALGSRFGLGYTLYYATPLLLTGLAVAIPYRAGLFNIGAEGQLVMGALATAAAGILWPTLPPILAVPLGFASALAGGALWGFIPGWLKARRGSHEVIVTILMNIVALSLANWFILNPLKDRASQVPETVTIGAGYHLGFHFLAGTPANVTLFVALLAAVALHLALTRSVWGFETAATGSSPSAARSAGVKTGRMQIVAMSLGGAMAGLVGVNEVMGQAFRLKDGFSPGYGYTGIAVALLGRGNPLGVIPAALFFGALHKGAADLDLDTERITRDLALVMQAVVILAVVLEPWVRRQFRFRRAS